MENEKLYRTEAVVMRHNNVGEADKILTVFTPKRGKLRLVAKGVRRTHSRLGGHVELFNQVNFLVATGRNLDIVTQTETIEVFPVLRADPAKLTYALYAAELLDKLTEEAQENYPLYKLLVDTLTALNGGADPTTTLRAYELHALAYLGYRPQLDKCVRCNAELQPVLNYFSPELGGVICNSCGQIERRSAELSVDALKVLRYLQKNPFASGPRLLLQPEVSRELELIMRSYTRYLLERELKSVELIHALD